VCGRRDRRAAISAAASSQDDPACRGKAFGRGFAAFFGFWFDAGRRAIRLAGIGRDAGLETAALWAVRSKMAAEGDHSMAHTLEEFSAACHRILTADPGPEGRKKVCALVQEVCADEDFVAKNLGDDVPERKILYEDPDLGFCILGHVNRGARESKPHDHGPTWAIYGQARGETVMTDWELVSAPGEGKPGKARRVRDYTLKPGMAYLYNEGALHSPRRDGPTRLIRIEGQNVEKIRRYPFEAA
jgi:hypothetical protein